MSDSIKDVKRRHEAGLLQLPGVVSVGIGRDDSGQPAIIVGLTAANPETESRIPKALEGYPVIVQVVGKITAH